MQVNSNIFLHNNSDILYLLELIPDLLPGIIGGVWNQAKYSIYRCAASPTRIFCSIYGHHFVVLLKKESRKTPQQDFAASLIYINK